MYVLLELEVALESYCNCNEQSGYNVTCADINLKQANETHEIILNSNGNGISIEMDVTKINDIENMIKNCKAIWYN